MMGNQTQVEDGTLSSAALVTCPAWIPEAREEAATELAQLPRGKVAPSYRSKGE